MPFSWKLFILVKILIRQANGHDVTKGYVLYTSESRQTQSKGIPIWSTYWEDHCMHQTSLHTKQFNNQWSCLGASYEVQVILTCMNENNSVTFSVDTFPYAYVILACSTYIWAVHHFFRFLASLFPVGLCCTNSLRILAVSIPFMWDIQHADQLWGLLTSN